MKRSLFLRLALATASAALLASCAQMRSATAPAAAAAPAAQALDAQLSGAQEVPPNTRPATGQADVQYDRATGTLRWRVSHTGLSGPITGAHFHGPAAAGANAGIVVPITGNLVANPIVGEARITPAQAGDLLAGLWYVNLHTAAHPGGEIRGQVRLKR